MLVKTARQVPWIPLFRRRRARFAVTQLPACDLTESVRCRRRWEKLFSAATQNVGPSEAEAVHLTNATEKDARRAPPRVVGSVVELVVRAHYALELRLSALSRFVPFWCLCVRYTNYAFCASPKYSRRRRSSRARKIGGLPVAFDLLACEQSAVRTRPGSESARRTEQAGRAVKFVVEVPRVFVAASLREKKSRARRRPPGPHQGHTPRSPHGMRRQKTIRTEPRSRMRRRQTEESHTCWRDDLSNSKEDDGAFLVFFLVRAGTILFFLSSK